MGNFIYLKNDNLSIKFEIKNLCLGREILEWNNGDFLVSDNPGLININAVNSYR